ncbi:hypothetical protein OAT18_01890 [Tenacibaculum sp.]|nr:hypothetical protein [Tenacibaculum sp.]
MNKFNSDLMNKITSLLLLVGILFFTQSCKIQNSSLTDIEKKIIIDSARTTVQKVFALSNNLKFMDGLNYYSGDSESYYTNNGTILTLDDYSKS